MWRPPPLKMNLLLRSRRREGHGAALTISYVFQDPCYFSEARREYLSETPSELRRAYHETSDVPCHSHTLVGSSGGIGLSILAGAGLDALRQLEKLHLLEMGILLF